MTELRLDWCGYEAAKYAVEHWHYSRRMVATIQKPVKIGVWEDGEFIGVVVFGCGASSDLGAPYGLEKMQVAELVRVALKEGHKTPVSKIVGIALKMLRKQSPGLRLIVSFADPYQGHVGAIYQAGNWIYAGTSSESTVYISKDGHEFHARNIGSYTGTDKYGVKKYSRSEMVREEKRPGNYRYLMPLDDAMRKQIEPLRKPYPKRERGETDSAPQSNAETEGASPIRSLDPHIAIVRLDAGG
jgi:hypothetical protein